MPIQVILIIFVNILKKKIMDFISIQEKNRAGKLKEPELLSASSIHSIRKHLNDDGLDLVRIAIKKSEGGEIKVCEKDKLKVVSLFDIPKNI